MIPSSQTPILSHPSSVMEDFVDSQSFCFQPWHTMPSHVDDQMLPEMILPSHFAELPHATPHYPDQMFGAGSVSPYLQDSFDNHSGMLSWQCHINDSFKYGTVFPPVQHPMPSPSIIDDQSSCLGSNWSDPGTSWSSPELGVTNSASIRSTSMGDCLQVNAVTMHDVHNVADYHNDASYDNAPLAPESPMRNFDCSSPKSDNTSQTADRTLNSTSQNCCSEPFVRRRRNASTKSPGDASKKVTKRPVSKVKGTQGSPKEIARHFACPFANYGCASTFGSKNEWKRHCHSQHMRLGYWRCDLCPSTNKKPNDFNRKDLFYQHIRRMHPQFIAADQLTEPHDLPTPPSSRKNSSTIHQLAEEARLAATAERCYRQLRDPPQRSSCLLCDETFEGVRGWENRLEHIGRHYEANKRAGAPVAQPRFWKVDLDTEAWLVQESILVEQNGHLILAES